MNPAVSGIDCRAVADKSVIEVCFCLKCALIDSTNKSFTMTSVPLGWRFDIHIREILTVQVYTNPLMNETHQWAADKKDTAKQYKPRCDLP